MGCASSSDLPKWTGWTVFRRWQIWELCRTPHRCRRWDGHWSKFVIPCLWMFLYAVKWSTWGCLSALTFLTADLSGNPPIGISLICYFSPVWTHHYLWVLLAAPKASWPVASSVCISLIYSVVANSKCFGDNNVSGHSLIAESHSAKEPFRASSWIIHFSVHQGKFPSKELASTLNQSSLVTFLRKVMMSLFYESNHLIKGKNYFLS